VTELALALAGWMAGAMNAVAGGGSFVSLPALIWSGVDPVWSNATSTLALWPASMASAVGYRTALPRDRRLLIGLVAVSLVGGVVGATLLVRTSSGTFMKLLPFLMLTAAGIFTFGPKLTRLARTNGDESAWPWAAWLVQIPASIYGGYFGGGLGFIMLASFALTLPKLDLHAHNGLKSSMAVMINSSATVLFIATGHIAWREGCVMTAGGILGGYLGARFARRLPQRYVRGVIAGIGWVLTLVFFIRAYG